MNVARLLLILLLGAVLGFVAGQRWTVEETPAPPDEWLARVGGEYIIRDEFIDEMERRGGLRPGQYQDTGQRRSLLNEMIVRKSLVAAAREEGFDERPEVARALDSILINRYQQSELQPLRESVEVEPEEIEAYFNARSDEYAVPARKRIAMIQIAVSPDAADEARSRARTRAEQAANAIEELDEATLHFGAVAREFSDDQASRYRGGVVGWISEEPVRPRFDPVVADAATRLEQPGDTTGILEGEDGFYIVRLVQWEPRQERSLEQLAPGIRQVIRREKVSELQRSFLDERLSRANPEINEEMLAEIEPLSEAEVPEPAPPAGPTNIEDER